MSNIIKAIKKYGHEACELAHKINTKYGEGASTIASCYDLGRTLTTRQVDAAINAGAEMARVRAKAKQTNILTDFEEDILALIYCN